MSETTTPNAAFLKAIGLLRETYKVAEPEWVALLKENPAVYAPHKPYGRYSSTVDNYEQPGCCLFNVWHPIHTTAERWIRARDYADLFSEREEG